MDYARYSVTRPRLRSGVIATLIICLVLPGLLGSVQVSFAGETPTGTPQMGIATPAATPLSSPEDQDGEAVIVETPVPTPEPVLGRGWIAYTDPTYYEEDDTSNHLVLIRPDGSERTVITTQSAANPSWSHDGTMLAFNGPTTPDPEGEESRGIWIIRDGTVSRIPNTEGCSLPAFTVNNDRVIYVCPNEVHAALPAEPILPEDLHGVSALQLYLPVMSYLGTIRSANIDGSDERIEYELTPEDLPTVWGSPTHDVMVVRIHVQPEEGNILVVFADAVYRPSSSGGVLFGPDFAQLDSIILDENGIIPTMLPDGTIVTITHCNADLCANGQYRELSDIEGNEFDFPFLNDAMPGAWTTDLSPEGDAVLKWSYYDGVWVEHDDGSMVVLEMFTSGSHPKWQPVPIEIDLPQS